MVVSSQEAVVVELEVVMAQSLKLYRKQITV